MPDRPRATRLPVRRLALVLAVWVVVAGGAVLLASALDSPVGAGARDEAQPAASGSIVAPRSGAQELPPLALVLDREPTAEILALAPAQQVERLRDLASAMPSPARWEALGSALQRVDDGAGAREAFGRALALDAESVPAQVGLVLADGATAGTSQRLAALAREYPTRQLIPFNRALVEIYRQRALPAEQALRRTAALDPETFLGRTAAVLLDSLANGGSGRNP